MFYKIEENLLIRENLSDQLAQKIIEPDVELLKVAEKKIKYFKSKK